MEKEASMKGVLDSFIDSYTKRDRSIGFSDWLEGQLRQEMPDMSEEEGNRLAGEIIDGVSSYDETLDRLNAAIDAGQSKEEWLAERLAEAYAGMPDDVTGERLQQIEESFSGSNVQLMRGIGEAQAEVPEAAGTGSTEWNEYSIKDKAYKIGKQAILSGMAVGANMVKDRVQGDGTADIADIVRETLQDGIKEDPREVKAVVAGAIKAAAEKGTVDIPEETICDMAGVAVESAEALYDAACGESTMTEAMDRIGRASVAAGCRYCAKMLKGIVSCLPFGSLLVNLGGCLLDYMKSPRFTEKVYTSVRGVAAAAWEGVRGLASKAARSVRNFLFG